MAQHYFTIGPVYLDSGLSGLGYEIVTPIAILPQNNLCIQNAGLLLGHRQTRWINIEATLTSRPVIAVDTGVQESCVRSVLKWC